MNNKINNKVIVFGGDHSNALGVIRALGENGVRPIVYSVTDNLVSSISKSKYVAESYIYKNEIDALGDIEERFGNEKVRPIIIPTSDGAASVIDRNYERLKKQFNTQNANEKSNTITLLMDKMEQFILSNKYGLRMARTIAIASPFSIEKIESLDYPLILKPQLSIDGKKEDIRIIKNKEGLEQAFAEFEEKGYKRLVLQEVVFFDYECDMSGYAYGGKVSISGFIQKRRIWPKQRGSLTFGTVRRPQVAKEEIEKIKKLICSIGYTGLFDVEFFVKGNDFYLNEINFRNSGLTYLYKDAYLCYNYVLSCALGKFIDSPQIKKDYNVMDEQAEIHQLLERNISFRQHRIDLKSSGMLLVKNKKDKKPGKIMIINKIINNLKLHSIMEIIKKVAHKSPEAILLKFENKLKTKDDVTNIKFVDINVKNIEQLSEKKENKKIIKKELAKNRAFGVAIEIDGRFVAWGFLRKKGARDRFVVIKNTETILVGNQFVLSEYRGRGYQRIVTNELIKRYVCNKQNNIYAVVYRYNAASLKNLEKCGFVKQKYFTIVRFAKQSIGKVTI